ncbi:MAG: glycosyltransferase [Fibromonadales bacterium]|nr:glycosyltransferase [Fibromonadales bacterium]
MNGTQQNGNSAEEMEKVPYVFELPNLKYSEEVKDLISIIVPIYNTELYLRDTLNSIIAQTYGNWEAVLVDDGSTDKCPEICTEYVKKDSRFKYICKKQNEGLLLARKTGLENSRGEFIANLDSDDFYKPQFLEKMFAKIKEGNNDFVYCNFEGLGKIKPPTVTCHKFSENKLENIFRIRDFLPNVCNKLIKRSVYAKTLFPQIHIVYGEDFIQSISVLYHSSHSEFVEDGLYIYRLNSVVSASLSFNTISKEKRYVQRVVYSIAAYLIIKQFFCADEAEKAFADENNFGNFADYFLLNKKKLVRYKIEYAENFVPAFLRGLKRIKIKSFKEKFRKIALVLACKDFPLLFRILRKARNMWLGL